MTESRDISTESTSNRPAPSTDSGDIGTESTSNRPDPSTDSGDIGVESTSNRRPRAAEQGRGDSGLASVLAAAERWNVGPVAAAVVGPDGLRAFHGNLDQRFDLASVTKPIAALAVLVAVEEGTLDLDEPAGPPGATVRHLLAHAAGLGFDGAVVAPAGERRTYSNAGFDALAAALERNAGMPAVEYVREAVLEPLAMRATDLPGGSLAHGARSTADDLARFAVELLRPTLVSAATLGAATSVQFPGLRGVLPGFGSQDPNDWGLGFELRDHKAPHWTGTANDPATFGHFGQSGSFLWVDPVLDSALIVLTGRPFGPWAAVAWPALADEVIAAVLG